MSASARGIVLQKDGEKLVIQASEADVVKFALGAQVLAEQQKAKKPKGMLTMAEIYALLDGDELLYTREGAPVARVTNVSVEHGTPIDVTSFGDSDSQYIYLPGAARFTIRAEGPL